MHKASFQLSRSLDNEIDAAQLNLEVEQLTEEQKRYFKLFTSSVKDDVGGMYFIDGPGGYGLQTLDLL